MTEPICPICVEKYNRTTHFKIECSYCNYSACRECYETYLLQNPISKCMNCSKEMTRETIVLQFTKKFVSTKYKTHRENCLFEQEKAMLPATQPIVEQIIENEKIKNEITKIRIEISNLYKKINDYEDILHRNNRSKQVERKSFVRKCPNSECRGFLSMQWKCNLCNRKTCKECNECMAEDDEHKCDPNNVETAKLLAKDSKTCPKCGEMIFKIDGCFAEDTLILLWDGTVKYSQDIRLGDILIGDDGNPRRVLQLCTGVDELYRVDQSNGMSYTVNSKHTLVLKAGDDVVNIMVDEYLKLPDELVKVLKGFKRFKQSDTSSKITVQSVGKGRYYGWLVDDNHRFLLSDFTVVRNCDQMYCTQCHTPFSWKTGKVETGTVHNPHYFEWLQRRNLEDNQIQQDMIPRCGREIDNFFVREMARHPILVFSPQIISMCRNLIHFREMILPNYETHRFNDNQDLRVSFLRNHIDENYFRTTLQKREKARQKKEDYYRLFAMMIQCITEIIYRYREYVNTRNNPEFIAQLDGRYDKIFLDEIENLVKYVNECLANISRTYSCQRYTVSSRDLSLLRY